MPRVAHYARFTRRQAPRRPGTPRRSALLEIRGLVVDCDGVLTTGGIYYDAAGPSVLRFDAKDGLGLALLARAGVPVGVLSGRATTIAERRLRELMVTHFRGQCSDKADGLVALCSEMGISPEHCAFVGDDLPDLAAFAKAGLAVAVADAAPEVLAEADWVTASTGGRGAVREVCEALLRARGAWPKKSRARRP